MSEKPPSSSVIMLITILVGLILSAIAVWFVINEKNKSYSNPTEDVEMRIAPVARIEITKAEPVPTGPMDAQTVYNKVCSVCHATGVTNAPKFGNKEDWAPRIAQGIDVLNKSALSGKNAMPAKGGATYLSDDNVKSAVAYMVDQAK